MYDTPFYVIIYRSYPYVPFWRILYKMARNRHIRRSLFKFAVQQQFETSHNNARNALKY